MALGRGRGRGPGGAVAVMNLQLNFIRPAEIRSASMVSVKALLQIGAVMIPLALIVVIALAYTGYAEMNSAVSLLEATWANTEVRQQRAQTLGQQLQERKSALNELNGWSASRMIWSAFMADFRSGVPPVIQVKVLQARQALEVGADGHPQRNLRILLNGRCEGPGAEEKVEMLRKALADELPLRETVNEARVAAFREDTEAGSTPDDRAFQVEVDFIPRSLHAAAPE